MGSTGAGGVVNVSRARGGVVWAGTASAVAAEQASVRTTQGRCQRGVVAGGQAGMLTANERPASRAMGSRLGTRGRLAVGRWDTVGRWLRLGGAWWVDGRAHQAGVGGWTRRPGALAAGGPLAGGASTSGGVLGEPRQAESAAGRGSGQHRWFCQAGLAG